MEIGIIWVIMLMIIAFVLGIFVYRNNQNLFGPIANKIDTRFDDLKAEILALKKALEEQDKVLKEKDKVFKNNTNL